MSNNNSKRFKLVTTFTALLFILMLAMNVGATPPIGNGTTLEFAGSGIDVGASQDNVNATAVGDLDNDGDLDIVSGSSIGENYEIIAWRNDGGSWTQQDVGASSDIVWSVAVADLDNDGDLDIVSGSKNAEDYEVIAWQNDGTPFAGLWTQQDIGATPNQTWSVAVGDLDNDGNLDVVSGDSNNNVIAWQNDGTPFTGLWAISQIAGTSTAEIRAVALGDLDNDGDLDIASASTTGEDFEFIVWQNDGTPFSGAWATNDVGATVANTRDIAIGDLDGDGDLDIVTTSESGEDYEFIAWQNDGTPFIGLWTQQDVGATSDNGRALAVGDLDQDGDLDLVTGSWEAEDFEVIAWQNDGTPFNGLWLQRDVGAAAHRALSVSLGDMDNDGDLDIISSHGSLEDFEIILWGNEAVHRNAPFADSGQALGNTDSRGLALGDVDGDGDLDAFVTVVGQSSRVYTNDGSDTFTDSGQPLGTWSSFGVALGDVDSDGDLDAFVANYGQANRLYLNNGSGTFTDSGQALGGNRSIDVSLGDVDGDGDLDAFVSNISGQANRIWLNDGNGTFTNSGQALGNSATPGVALGDLDGDGDLDAFAANAIGYGQVANQVYTNNGSGTFTDSGQTLGNSDSTDVALGDVDGDGDLDAFVTNRNQPNRVYINNGSGIFADSGQTLGNSNSTDVALGDVDGDGDLDAFVTNQVGQANRIWLNDGTGTFTDSSQALGSSESYAAALGDVNGDGDLDAFVTNKLGQADRVWRNEGGSAGFIVTDTFAGTYIPNSTEDDVLQVDFTHNGIASDRDLELNFWNLDLFRSDCATPLTTSEANAFVDNLRVRLDDGDGIFETDGSDVLVADIGTLSLSGGVQQVTFTDGDSNVQIAGTGSASYWVSILATADANQQDPNDVCINVDPDEDMLVEGKTPDFGVSVQDSTATNTGSVPTVITLQSLSIRQTSPTAILLLAGLFLAAISLIGWLLRRRVA